MVDGLAEGKIGEKERPNPVAVQDGKDKAACEYPPGKTGAPFEVGEIEHRRKGHSNAMDAEKDKRRGADVAAEQPPEQKGKADGNK